MDIKEVVRGALKDLIVPEMDKIKQENGEIKEILKLTNKRLDDINLHLADHSRRIDETNNRIDQTNSRIDQTNQSIVAIGRRFDDRLNRLYEVIVRREEHQQVETRLMALEREMAEIKQRLAV